MRVLIWSAWVAKGTRQTGCVDGTVQSAAGCAAAILRSFGNDVEFSRRSATVVELAFKDFAPFDAVATPALRAALFGFFEMGTSVVSGRFTATRAFDGAAGVETWCFQDHQRWMQ